MNKTNNNSIVFGLKILSILAFSLLVIPATASATLAYTPSSVENPTPVINSISPSSINENITSNTITITGSGFIPTSVVRVNGSNRYTTFIDYSHVQVQLNGNDFSNGNGFYVNVFNEAPGGGYSNASYFTIRNVVATANTNTGNNNTNGNVNSNGNSNTSNSSATKSNTNKNTNTSTSKNTTNTTNSTTTNANSNYSNLASNAIFGSNSFMPSGLIQWILFAIIILLLVILVRKLFGAKKNYDESPMKHA
ncbi:MAG: hypothetical protein WC793_00130 [Candidatus Paceibacterota bacterium]|jgi:hypothetical protein